MKILITGATGLIGTQLVEKLFLSGYDDIRILTRNKKVAESIIAFPVEIFEWNPEKKTMESEALKEVDYVLHLAGENISDGRWTEKKKKTILESRIKSSELLMDEIKKLKVPPKKFIFSSAIGIYGSSTNETTFNVESTLGIDFLAEVCKSWENSIFSYDIPGMKVQCIRTGVVLSPSGGALAKMLPAFQMGVAGKLGSGKQYFSWIHIDDLVSQFIFLLEKFGTKRIYNGVSPTPLTNNVFTKALGNELRRPTFFAVPALVLQTVFGEMSEILLKGQRVTPTEFLNDGFKFEYPTIELALNNLLKFTSQGEVVFKKYLWIDEDTSKVFDFFSDENNLEKITPPYLNFKITGKSTKEISAGTFIDYKLKIHGVPAKWKTHISSFVKDKTFTDEQLKGPYAKWVHQHDFIPCKNGTLMKDEVVYKVPMGILGRFVAGNFIKKDVSSIFKYRNETIKNNFTR